MENPLLLQPHSLPGAGCTHVDEAVNAVASNAKLHDSEALESYISKIAQCSSSSQRGGVHRDWASHEIHQDSFSRAELPFRRADRSSRSNGDMYSCVIDGSRCSEPQLSSDEDMTGALASIIHDAVFASRGIKAIPSACWALRTLGRQDW